MSSRQQDRGRAGAVGEATTAKIIHSALTRATVLHDLRVKLDGPGPNMDHVVVSGRRVWVIDSKRWQKGTYWSVGSQTFRWPLHTAHTHERTMRWALDVLKKDGIHARGLYVIHGDVQLRGCRPNGHQAMTTAEFRSWIEHLTETGDPRLVSQLARRINHPTRR